MKKNTAYLLLTVFLAVLTAGKVSAQQRKAGEANQPKTVVTSQESEQPGQEEPGQERVQNQNQLQVENRGEESGLTVQNQEKESLQVQENKFGQQQISFKQQVEQTSAVIEEALEQEEVLTKEGETKKVLQEQKQGQEKLKEDTEKLGQRQGVVRFILGPDWKALKALKQEMEQNQVRINQLNSLKLQVQNQGEEQLLQQVVQTLEEQNTSLQEQINKEEGNMGILGWLFRLFVN